MTIPVWQFIILIVAHLCSVAYVVYKVGVWKSSVDLSFRQVETKIDNVNTNLGLNLSLSLQNLQIQIDNLKYQVEELKRKQLD